MSPRILNRRSASLRNGSREIEIIFPFCEFSRLYSQVNFPPAPRAAALVDAMHPAPRRYVPYPSAHGAIPLAAVSGEAGSGECEPDQPAPAVNAGSK